MKKSFAHSFYLKNFGKGTWSAKTTGTPYRADGEFHVAESLLATLTGPTKNCKVLNIDKMLSTPIK